MVDLRAESGVLDGAAIAIRDVGIVAVGDRIEARRVDAEGQVITPGFVDAHLHLGAGKPYQRCTGPGLFYGGGRLGRR